MSHLTFSGVSFAELVVETIRRWKSEQIEQKKKKRKKKEHSSSHSWQHVEDAAKPQVFAVDRLCLHLWDYSIGVEDLDFLRERLEIQVPRDTPLELVFNHCTLQNSTLAVDHLKELVAQRNVEALHWVEERQASSMMSYPDVAGIVRVTRHLRELTFSFQNHPGSAEIFLKAPGSSIAQTMQTLTVDAMRVPMETPYVQELVEGLILLPHLKCINLQGLACKDDALLVIIRAILAMENLKELKLDITDAILTYASLISLAMLFKHLAAGTLFQLYIWDSKNLFADADQQHVDAFGSALETCRAYIRVFSLQDVGLRSSQLVRIFRALEYVGGREFCSTESNHGAEVEITGSGFFLDPASYAQLVVSLSRMTGVGHLEIDDEHTYEEWDPDQDSLLLAALKRNPRLESMSFWTGTTERVEVMKAMTAQIFRRNRSLTCVSRLLSSPCCRAESLPAYFAHLLRALSRQAGPSVGDPMYQVLRHFVHLLCNHNNNGCQ